VVSGGDDEQQRYAEWASLAFISYVGVMTSNARTLSVADRTFWRYQSALYHLADGGDIPTPLQP